MTKDEIRKTKEAMQKIGKTENFDRVLRNSIQPGPGRNLSVLIDKCQTNVELETINSVVMTLTGQSVNSLVEKARDKQRKVNYL